MPRKKTMTEPERAQVKSVPRDVVRKRIAARTLNEMFSRGALAASLDRRTVSRLARLREELKNGETKKGVPLRSTDVLIHATELIRHGVPFAEISQLCGKRYHQVENRTNPPRAILEQCIEVQEAFGGDIDPQVWALFNIDPKLLEAA